MLNDIKDWVVQKGNETKEVARGAAEEVTTTGVMDWSATVWLIIGGFVLLMAIGALSNR